MRSLFERTHRDEKEGRRRQIDWQQSNRLLGRAITMREIVDQHDDASCPRAINGRLKRDSEGRRRCPNT